MAQTLQELAKPRTGKYIAGVIVWLLIIAALLFGAYRLWPEGDAEGISVGVILAGIAILWIGLSTKSLPNTERVRIKLFGMPVLEITGGGLALVPFILFSLKYTSSGLWETELPGEPEDIQKTSDKEPLRVVEIKKNGEVVSKMRLRPIRITTKRPATGGDPDDPLNTQMTIEPSFWFQWRVADSFLFELTLGSPEEATRNLRDIGETQLTNIITQRTPAELTTDFVAISEEFRDAVEDQVKELGIRIHASGLNPIDYGEGVAKKMKEIAEAKAGIAVADAQAEQVRKTAAGERDRLALEGEGQGAAEEAVRAGRGRGIKSIAKATMGKNAQRVLAAEVVEKTVGEGDSTIIGLDQAIELGANVLKGAT